MAEPKPGDRVVVQNTMLYNGREGVLHEIEEPDQNLASWDFLVVLDEFEDEPKEVQRRTIGVDKDQVRLPEGDVG